MNNSAEKLSFKDQRVKEEEAKRSLNNYIEQLKFHFGLSNEETVKVVEFVVKYGNFNNPEKKWWQFWR